LIKIKFEDAVFVYFAELNFVERAKNARISFAKISTRNNLYP